jgi:hypothetical protein
MTKNTPGVHVSMTDSRSMKQAAAVLPCVGVKRVCHVNLKRQRISSNKTSADTRCEFKRKRRTVICKLQRGAVHRRETSRMSDLRSNTKSER